jgi:isoleucyl-tRNA synthetase
MLFLCFVTTTVLSTALFDKPPFKNLVVNGLVLAEDGKKMSKRLKNYPDPNKVQYTTTLSYGCVFCKLHLDKDVLSIAQ